MPTQEERLTTLEKTIALLQQKSSSIGIQELSRNVTVLLGIVSSQQLDIKEIKISLITVEERLDSMEKKFDQMLALLTTFTNRPE